MALGVLRAARHPADVPVVQDFGSGFWVQDVGFKNLGSGFWVRILVQDVGSRCRVQDVGKAIM